MKAFILVGALALGGCVNPNMTIDPAVQAKVNAGVATAEQKAQVALATICNNYTYVDLAFQGARSVWTIQQKYVDAEASAIALLDRTCAAPPSNVIQAYAAAKDALATATSIRSQFRAKT